MPDARRSLSHPWSRVTRPLAMSPAIFAHRWIANPPDSGGRHCGVSLAALLLGVVAVWYQIATGHRHLGLEQDGRLGV